MYNYKQTLETERLVLRSPTPDDYNAYQSWCGNPENTRYMSFGPNTEEQTREWLLQAKPSKDFAVVIKESGIVIGSCGIYPKTDNYMADIGWILHKDYWKRGYGTELGGELIRYGFEDLKLGRIQAPCAAVNYGSYRVMERNGMRREALHRKAFWARVDKEWVDEAWYAILAEDYFSKTGNKEIESTLNVNRQQQRIIPFLTFHGNAEEAMNFYASILPNAEIEILTRFEKDGRGDEGKVLIGIMSIFGQRVQFLDMQAEYDCPTFTWATSFYIDCKDETEYDTVMGGLSDGGIVMMQEDNYMHFRKVAWVTDRYGVTWQPVLQ